MLQISTRKPHIACHCACIKLLMENLETRNIAAHFVPYKRHSFNSFLNIILDLNFYCRELVSYDFNFKSRLNKILYCNSQHNQSGRKEGMNKSNISRFFKLNHILCFPDGSRRLIPTWLYFLPIQYNWKEYENNVYFSRHMLKCNSYIILTSHQENNTFSYSLSETFLG